MSQTISYKLNKIDLFPAHPPVLGLIQLVLQLSLGLGEVGVAAVQLVQTPLKLSVLGAQAGLEGVEVLVLAGEVVDLGLEPPDLVLEGLGLGGGVLGGLVGGVEAGAHAVNLQDQGLLLLLGPAASRIGDEELLII